MNKKIKKILFLFFCFGFLPLLVFAEENVTSTEETIELPNPLGTTDVTLIVSRIVKAVLGFLGLLTLIMFIYGGFLWLTSGGNEKQVKKGKDTLVWAVLGLALIFFSYAILKFVLEVLLNVSK
jgi:hypothetical protein